MSCWRFVSVVTVHGYSYTDIFFQWAPKETQKWAASKLRHSGIQFSQFPRSLHTVRRFLCSLEGCPDVCVHVSQWCWRWHWTKDGGMPVYGALLSSVFSLPPPFPPSMWPPMSTLRSPTPQPIVYSNCVSPSFFTMGVLSVRWFQAGTLILNSWRQCWRMLQALSISPCFSHCSVKKRKVRKLRHGLETAPNTYTHSRTHRADVHTMLWLLNTTHFWCCLMHYRSPVFFKALATSFSGTFSGVFFPFIYLNFFSGIIWIIDLANLFTSRFQDFCAKLHTIFLAILYWSVSLIICFPWFWLFIFKLFGGAIIDDLNSLFF